jgi:hypothetical protein
MASIILLVHKYSVFCAIILRGKVNSYQEGPRHFTGNYNLMVSLMIVTKFLMFCEMN